jgi:hypothetical protein
MEALDGELVVAHEGGMLLICGNAIRRQIFGCIMSYSTDYPER